MRLYRNNKNTERHSDKYAKNRIKPWLGWGKCMHSFRIPAQVHTRIDIGEGSKQASEVIRVNGLEKKTRYEWTVLGQVSISSWQWQIVCMKIIEMNLHTQRENIVDWKFRNNWVEIIMLSTLLSVLILMFLSFGWI